MFINLDQRPDRREAFEREFAREAPGHDLHRFAARTSGVAQSPVVNACIGCTLSHRGVIELARDRGWEQVVVFEDDVTLVEQAGARWMEAVERLGDRPWWMLYLGLNAQGPLLKVEPGVYRASRCLALHAQIYHRRSYDHLLRNLPADEAAALPFVARYKNADQWYERHLVPRRPCFAVWPHLAHQRPDVSDISGAATRWTGDDERTGSLISRSAARHRLKTAAWWTLRYPVVRVAEAVRPTRKRAFYAAKRSTPETAVAG